MITKRSVLLTAVLCTGFFNSLDAQPAISDVSGSFSHGSIITISGTRFGTKISDQAAPVKFDNFEDGTIGQPITSSGWWEAEVPYNNKTYDNTSILPRNQFSTKHIRWHSYGWGASEGEMGGTFGKGNLGFETTKKAFINLWAYVDYVDGTPESGPGGSCQLKWITLLTDGPQPWGDPSYYRHESNPSVLLYLWTNDFVHTSDFARHSLDVYLNPVSGSTDFAPEEHYWLNISLLYKESSAFGVADGAVLLNASRTPATDGAYLRCAQTNAITRTTGDNGPIHSLVLGYFITSGFHECSTYWDDIYIDNSWARVEIGDAPVYDNCTHREIQVCSEWSDNAVRFKANQGSFQPGQAYVFVIDENNNASAGYPVAISPTGIQNCAGKRSAVSLLPQNGRRSIYTLRGQKIVPSRLPGVQFHR
jgi:hypothetical protein